MLNVKARSTKSLALRKIKIFQQEEFNIQPHVVQQSYYLTEAFSKEGNRHVRIPYLQK